jgi:ferredoxin-NADP reductase
VAFAAGSGITPLLSIIRTTLAAEPQSRFTLFYGNRASSTVMFKEELAALKDIYLTRFNLVHVLSREAQDIELLHGRIDRVKADALMKHWLDLSQVDVVFVCGPDGMMQAVADALKGRGYPMRKCGSSASRPACRGKSIGAEAGRGGPRPMRSDRRAGRRHAHVHAGKGQRKHSRSRLEERPRAAILVQERRLLDVPREAHRRRSRHGRQLRP